LIPSTRKNATIVPAEQTQPPEKIHLKLQKVAIFEG
jgi:hypothetical protein